MLKLAALKFCLVTALVYRPEYREIRHQFDIENVFANIVLALACVCLTIFAMIIVFENYKNFFSVVSHTTPDNLMTVAVKLFTKGALRCKHAYKKTSTSLVCIYCNETVKIQGGNNKNKPTNRRVARYEKWVQKLGLKISPSEHLCRANMSKLIVQEWPHIQNFKLYTLDAKSRDEQKEITFECPEDLYNYYSRFCNCKNTNVVRYTPERKDVITELEPHVHTFARCPLNDIAALLARHLYTKLYPRMDAVSQYEKLMKPLVTELTQKVADYDAENDYDFITHTEHYTGGKKAGVIKGYLDLVSGKPMDCHLNCFTKTGEWQRTHPEAALEGKMEGRPRQIWGPSNTLKSLPGWMNRLYIKACKKIIPSIICGYSQEALSKRITSDRFELVFRHGEQNIKVLVFDGSSHDSHQWYHLINVIDTILFSKVGPMLEKYGIPKDLIRATQEAVLSDWFSASATTRIDGQDLLLYSLKICGTVFSGHPTRTTLGNSLRTLSYIVFLIWINFGLEEATNVFWGKSKNLIVYVAGDDVMIAGKASYVLKMSSTLSTTHCKNVDYGVWGLGQCAREVFVGEYDFIDFLSRDGYVTNEFKVTRKIDRVLAAGNWSINITPLADTLKQKEKIVEAARVMNWSFVKQNQCWASGLKMIENELKRRSVLGCSPSTKKTLRLHQIASEQASHSIGSTVYDHPNQESWLQMLEKKHKYPLGFLHSLETSSSWDWNLSR